MGLCYGTFTQLTHLW